MLKLGQYISQAAIFAAATSLVVAQTNTGKPSAGSADRVTAFRFREDFKAKLDRDVAWAAGVSQNTALNVDQPFRLRFEVETPRDAGRRQYNLQYQKNGGEWKYAEAHEFPYESMESPVVSIVSCPAYFNGQEAENLLPVSTLPNNRGAGVSLSSSTPGWVPKPGQGASSEYEWAVVIRNWSDGPVQAKAGDRISFRMVDQHGRVLEGSNPEVTVQIPNYHLGGTFVETPAHIGPWQNKADALYFIMEPTETDNVFMIVKSTDDGKTWSETDSSNRPKADDLEGVSSTVSKDGIIHIIHQRSREVYYHAFDMSKDRWVTNSQLICRHDVPPTQVSGIALRPDGTMVAVFGYGKNIAYSIRSKNGQWSKETVIADPRSNGITSPVIANDRNGVVEFLYKTFDGKAWNRQLTPKNVLTPPIQIAENLGTDEKEGIAILPLEYNPDSQELFAAYRLHSGDLVVRKKNIQGIWSEGVVASRKPVVTNAEDSEQAAADLTIYGDKIFISYIPEDKKSVFVTELSKDLKIVKHSEVVSNVNASWVRGRIITLKDGSRAYALVVDEGSKGGSGFNEFVIYRFN